MRTLFIILSLLLPSLSYAAGPDFDAAVDSLDRLLGNRRLFLEQKLRHIDTLKSDVRTSRNPVGRTEALCRVADCFRLVDIDSALYYYDLAMRSVDDEKSIDYKRIAWRKSSLMPVSGLLHEGRELFDATAPADSAFLHEYYSNGVDLYLYLSDFYTQPEYRRKYDSVAMELNRRVLPLLDEDSDEYRFHHAYDYFHNGQYQLAVGELNELLERLSPTDNLYARVHAILAQHYAHVGKPDEARYHLAMAAGGDVRTATQEFTALTRLGMNLYQAGDVERAYRYLMLALESSVTAGSRLRILENAQSLPLISQAFRQRDHRRTIWLTVAMAVLFVALLVIIAMMIMMRRKQKHVNELQNRLKDNVQLKDAYIGQVLSMCSLYIERMEEFNRLAGRKIKAGQVQDLYQMIESGKILQEQATQFYEVFDKAFFGIYPDFVEKVNELLLPERRIVLLSPDRLTPECRLLAFMRLGVDDSAQLSKLLGLSLNTIYTYRNRLKSRAVNRGDFERNVRNIGLIE